MRIDVDLYVDYDAYGSGMTVDRSSLPVIHADDELRLCFLFGDDWKQVYKYHTVITYMNGQMVQHILRNDTLQLSKRDLCEGPLVITVQGYKATPSNAKDKLFDIDRSKFIEASNDGDPINICASTAHMLSRNKVKRR